MKQHEDHVLDVAAHQSVSHADFQRMPLGDVAHRFAAHDEQLVVGVDLAVFLRDAHHVLRFDGRRLEGQQLVEVAEGLAHLVGLGTTGIAAFVDADVLALQVHHVQTQHGRHLLQRGVRQGTQGLVVNRHRFIELLDVYQFGSFCHSF